MKIIIFLLYLVIPTAWANDMEIGKEESQRLYDEALPFAKQMLSEYGEFIPYGYVMTSDDEFLSVSGTNKEEQPKSSDIIEVLEEGFRQEAEKGNYKATAIVYDVRIRSPETGDLTDAIAIALDHRSGYSVIALMPYSIESGQPQYGKISAITGKNSVFK